MVRSRMISVTRQAAIHQTRKTSLFSASRQVLSSIYQCTPLQPVRTPMSIQSSIRAFQSSSMYQAQAPTADALMENLNDLYATAKDEFEIAAEETEKKTVYAADDREAAKEAFGLLKEAYERALRESGPEVAKEVQTRTGPRIKELENALTAVEEMAMED